METLLDPRFRLGYYFVRNDDDPNKNEDLEDILRIERHIYTSGYQTSALDAANTELPSCIPNEFEGQKLKKPRTALVTSIDELDTYMRGTREAPITLPLLWWKSQQKTFPTLAKMAMDYLSIAGTSTSSERAFSAANLLITDEQCSPRARIIRASCCLANWLRWEARK